MENAESEPPQMPKMNFWVRMDAPQTEIGSEPAEKRPPRHYWYNKLTKQTTWKKPLQVKEEERLLAELASAERVIGLRDIGNTKWSLAMTNWKQYFYHNSSLGLSQWECPEDPYLRQCLDDLRRKEANSLSSEAQALHDSVETDEEQRESYDRNYDDNEGFEDSLEDYDIDFQLENLQNGDAEVTPHENMEQFKEMLRDHHIDPYELWEKVLPKLAGDERYFLVSNEKQKLEIFAEYCSETVSQFQSNASSSSLKQQYRQLLEETVKSTKIKWEDFSRRYKKDSRFLNVDIRDRESLFNEFLSELKSRKEKQFEENFTQLLKDKSSIITSHSKWVDVKSVLKSDLRYATVRPERREQLFQEFLRNRF